MTTTTTTRPAPTAEHKPTRPVFQPRVDILDNDGDLILVAEIPGADEGHTEVSLDKNILTIRGSIPNDAPDGYELAHQEYRVGDFERSFTLARDVDRDGIEATVADGVLRVRLPKQKDAGRKTIAVTSA